MLGHAFDAVHDAGDAVLGAGFDGEMDVVSVLDSHCEDLERRLFGGLSHGGVDLLLDSGQ